MAESCETPLVVGLYGTWGIGKTSMMRPIEAQLDADQVKTVRFDPWQHQFDDNPVLALLQTAIRDLDENTREQLKTTLISLATALGSVALKALTGLDVTHIRKIVDEVEEERFILRERQLRLREYFETIVKAVRGQHQKRIVFFIDDLDRCMPPQVLKMLEALKLYLNLDGCVYFLGLDREPIEQSIRHHYTALELTEAEYLDKIIQLPFTISPIAPDAMTSFVKPLLPHYLETCHEALVNGLAHNPRQVKRFINTLTLNHLLAAELEIPGYDPLVFALVLIIQLRSRMLYQELARQPSILRELLNSVNVELRAKYLGGDPDLERILKSFHLPNEDILPYYIYLTEITSLVKTGSATVHELLSQRINEETVAAYTKWRYPEMPIDENVQRTLIGDLDHNRFRTIFDIDVAVNAAFDAVEAYKSEKPEWFKSGTDCLTKSVGFHDDDFRKKHGFAPRTRQAFEEHAHRVSRKSNGS